MEQKTQNGYLMLADISGYTSFVAKTEIEHANLAVSYLLESIIHKISGLFMIAKLEGDAVFTHAALEHMKCSKVSYFKRCGTYEHLGDVDIYCMDMQVRYEEMKNS
jgi:hypothetical protein